MTVDEKLNELETLLLDSILDKARQQEPLSSYEMQLVIKWTKPKSTPKASNLTCEPLVTKGEPLPFLKERLPFREAVESLEEHL